MPCSHIDRGQGIPRICASEEAKLVVNYPIPDTPSCHQINQRQTTLPEILAHKQAK